MKSTTLRRMVKRAMNYIGQGYGEETAFFCVARRFKLGTRDQAEVWKAVVTRRRKRKSLTKAEARKRLGRA